MAALAPYLSELGVSHVYLSPVLQAAPGSTHGYDVANPSQVSAALGGEENFELMCRTLHAHQLRVLLDIVPNHMSVALPAANPWWWDVLANGRQSAFAAFFDIDWDHSEPAEARGKVLLPILGDAYARVLEEGHIRLASGEAETRLQVYDKELPLRAGSVEEVAAESKNLVSGSDKLISGTDTHALDPARAEVIKAINESQHVLHQLLEKQHYRLAHYRVAQSELNYRRFFDINELVGVRVEDQRVFQHTHQRIAQWVNSGMVHGLRVDHPDGLADPKAYFQGLRAAAPADYVVAEKILERGEALPSDWAVDGTTGYDFLGVANALFVWPGSEDTLSCFYDEFTQGHRAEAGFSQLAREKKEFALRSLLSADVHRVVRVLRSACYQSVRWRDVTAPALLDALVQVITHLPVYRTYFRAEEVASTKERELLRDAVSAARRSHPELQDEALSAIEELLLNPNQSPESRQFLSQFQQVSGPAMAKGLEDTAFYCFSRLASLNEVGGDPAHYGLSLTEWHRFCEGMSADWPQTMTATSTHDTKRSEDARIRISLLSQCSQRWISFIREWDPRLRDDGRSHGFTSLLDAETVYLFYQMLVAAWPIDEERLTAFLMKAAREAKVHSSWHHPNAGYEAALSEFCQHTLRHSEFTHALRQFLAPLVDAAHRESLSQVMLKLTSPGVPDIYQGNELWDFSLTDPDNRRPVDFDLRRRLLTQTKSMSADEVMEQAGEGVIKLWLTHHVLKLRMKYPRSFNERGSYRGLELAGEGAQLAGEGAQLAGEGAQSVVAFARGENIVVMVQRFTLAAPIDESLILTLPAGSWRSALHQSENALRGQVGVLRACGPLPVAVLVRD